MLESHFNRETKALEQSIEAILGHGRMVNDSQTLAHYNRILVAIRDARQLGRLSDLLTEERIGAMMELVSSILCSSFAMFGIICFLGGFSG